MVEPLTTLTTTVGAALLTHLGKKVIDTFWSKRRSDEFPIVDQAGNLGYLYSDSGRIVVGRDFTVPRYQEYEQIFGKIFIPDTIDEWIEGDEILIVLIIGANNQQVYLFEADLEYSEYEIYLPHGTYYFYSFLLDPDADNLFDAEIYAIGFHCTEDIDLSDFDQFALEDEADIWNFIDDSPKLVKRGGPFYEHFILIDTDMEPDLPIFFSELVGG